MNCRQPSKHDDSIVESSASQPVDGQDIVGITHKNELLLGIGHMKQRLACRLASLTLSTTSSNYARG